MAAGLTITNDLSKLQSLFNDVKNVYYNNKELKSADLGTALTVAMELPVLEDGVSLNTGDPDVTRIKITTGASIAGKVNELFMDKKGEVAGAADIIIQGATYSGSSYSLAPKKVSGSLILMSEDKMAVIVLPNVEIYASFVAADGDNPAYFNVNVTPLENSRHYDSPQDCVKSESLTRCGSRGESRTFRTLYLNLYGKRNQATDS